MSTHPERKEAPAARRRKLLLVEDHEHMARLICRLLEAEGFEVQAAGTLADALSLANRDHFDLVLSDLSLPDGDGRALPGQLRRVPAIALSGYGASEDIRNSLAAGFVEHLVKPVDAGELVAAVRRALEQRRTCAVGPAQ